MNDRIRRPRNHFYVAAAVLAVVTLAVFRLPESFVIRLEANRPLTAAQAAWAYRLLLGAAIGQAVFVGFALLNVERVKRARQQDSRVADMPRARVVSLLARNAAGMALLTLVYGLSAFAVTGSRGGFWPFVVLTVAQLAWYYRRVGEVTEWLSYQPEAHVRRIRDEWHREPEDYTPPIARGLEESGRSPQT